MSSGAELLGADGAAELAEAGRFTADARNAATSHALPLLASYFADAPTWSLTSSQQVASSDPDLAHLASLVRMRVALAASPPLIEVLRHIVPRASFQYEPRREESAGMVRGQLDLPRYVRLRARTESPRRYPVRILRRRYATDENSLAVYAAAWVRRELGRAPLDQIPVDAPERRSVLQQRLELGKLLREPVFTQARPLADRTWRRGELDRLVDSVKGRVTSGRVAARDAYAALIEWVEHFDLEKVGAAAGAIEWAFYDDRFDTKLFEIWSLGLVIEALRTELGAEEGGVQPLYERHRSAIATWNLGAIKVRVYFQASLRRLTGDLPRWGFTEGAPGHLEGFPDLAAIVERVGVAESTVILADPKLRIRAGVPTEELYKLLGYFGNVRLDRPPRGAIIFYAPGTPRTYALEDSGGHSIVAIGVDPQDLDDSRVRFGALAKLIGASTGLPDGTLGKFRQGVEGDQAEREEGVTAVRQLAAVQTMNSVAASLPASTLDPVRKTTELTLRNIWDLLSEDTRTMLVTAEFFGQQAPRDADHSGPLLGLAAACERVLFEQLFADVHAAAPAVLPQGQTFGTLLRWLTDAFRRRRTEEGRALGQYLAQHRRIDARALAGLIDDLWTLNNDFRIPAAHRDLVPSHLWADGRQHILTGPEAVLRRLVVALNR